MPDSADGDAVTTPTSPAENLAQPSASAAAATAAVTAAKAAQAAAGTPAAAATASGSGTAPEAEPAAKEPETLLDALADLLQLAVNYLRQQAAALMREKVVLPGQKLGAFVAFAFAAAFLLALGLGFVAVAWLLLLAQWLTWPGALGLIGAVLLVGAGILTVLKIRSFQR